MKTNCNNKWVDLKRFLIRPKHLHFNLNYPLIKTNCTLNLPNTSYSKDADLTPADYIEPLMIAYDEYASDKHLLSST